MKTMTSLERVMTVLDGHVPDRVPVALHNFLMAGRMTGADLGDVLRDGDALAEAQLAAWREFGHDLIMHENGVHAEAEALGCGVLYQPGIAPHVEHPVIETIEDIDKLRVPDPETTFPLNEVLKATRILTREIGGKVFINGRADQGPIALALALCGPERFLLWAAEPGYRPHVLRLLAITSRMNIVFGEAQIRAGANGSCIGLVGTSLISPATFDELELPFARAFGDAIRRVGGRAFMHACGDETKLLEHLVATGADCLELDPGTDPAACKTATHGRTAVMGMIEPVHVLRNGTIQDVRQRVTEILRIMAPHGGFIMGPGCALPPDTPAENIHELMTYARTMGAYARDGSLPAIVP
jgi:uroporphyrinogen decarboxylase